MKTSRYNLHNLSVYKQRKEKLVDAVFFFFISLDATEAHLKNSCGGETMTAAVASAPATVDVLLYYILVAVVCLPVI